MKIPFNNFAREYASLKSEIEGALQRVMQRGHFILGPEVQQFEKDFAAYNGVRYGVAVNSGTDALYRAGKYRAPDGDGGRDEWCESGLR